MKNKKEALVSKLRDFIGNKKAIVGISGGIDSAVIASLCTEALGKHNVVGVTLPYGKQSTKDSELLIKTLGIEHLNYDIKPTVDEICPDLHADKITLGNIMARTRMVHLYALSNSRNGLVIGTTNRSEAEMGYYTKYGDGAVDVEPIANLWKREVYELGKELGVPISIMTKAPSANLWENQTDEDEFGFTYDDIERCFTHPESLDKHVLDKITAVSRQNEHKKHMPPSFEI